MFDYYSKIDAYIAGNLSNDDRADFEKELSQNSTLKKVVRDHQLYSTIAEGIIDHNISQSIIGVQNKNKNRKRFAIAALVASGVVLLLVVFLSKNKEKARSKIFAEYYSSPLGNTSRGDISSDSLVKYCEIGHRQLDDGNRIKAKASFLKSISNEEGVCKEKSYFYLSLISILDSEPKSIIVSYLNEINSGEITGYEDKANKLLNDLDSF